VLQLVDAPRVELRREVAELLARAFQVERVGPRAPDVARALATLLEDHDLVVQRNAAIGLERLGWWSKPGKAAAARALAALPAEPLPEALESLPEALFRLVSWWAEDPLAVALAGSAHPSVGVRVEAVDVLEENAALPRVRARLRELLADPDAQVRWRAVEPLLEGTPDDKDLPALRPLLDDPDAELVAEVAQHLAAHDPGTRSRALTALERLEESADERQAAQLAVARWRLTGGAEGVVARLVRDQAKSAAESRYGRWAPKELLELLRAEPARAAELAPALAAPAQDEPPADETLAQGEAFVALAAAAELGPAARLLEAELRALVKVSVGDMHRAAARALACVTGDSEPALRAARAALAARSDNVVERIAAFEYLASLGTLAAAVAPEAVAALAADPSTWVQREAAKALGALGPSASDTTVPALLSLTERESDEPVLGAVYALERLARECPPARRALEGVARATGRPARWARGALERLAEAEPDLAKPKRAVVGWGR
jgi:hypothetical protein